MTEGGACLLAGAPRGTAARLERLVREFSGLCPEGMRPLMGLARYAKGGFISRHDDGASEVRACVSHSTWHNLQTLEHRLHYRYLAYYLKRVQYMHE